MLPPNKKQRFLSSEVILISDDEEYNYEAEHSSTIHSYPIVISDDETGDESEATSEIIQDKNLSGLDEVILISDDEKSEEHDVIIMIDDE